MDALFAPNPQTEILSARIADTVAVIVAAGKEYGKSKQTWKETKK